MENEAIQPQQTTSEVAKEAQICQVMREAAKAFSGTVEFYESAWGGENCHSLAMSKTAEMNEFRRKYIETKDASKLDWTDIAAVAQENSGNGQILFDKIYQAATDEFRSGRLTSKVSQDSAYGHAQYVAIRDSFIEEWKPRGGIELALIDMMTLAFVLQMYWSSIAHSRATNTFDEQKKEVMRYESKGWKSPYQRQADAISQAHQLSDSYNRQFLRVLRQLRDLRRYSPVIIQNHGQVNLAEQQINMNQPKSGEQAIID